MNPLPTYCTGMYDEATEKIEARVCAMLKNLHPHLTYHSIEHTLDVVEQSVRIAREEGIKDEKDLFLLKVASFYHDTGFLRTYKNHESISCAIFLENSLDYAFSEEEKEVIINLIMATHLPQQPKTLLEKVICDADLDYIGRADFFKISDFLRREFLAFAIVKSDKEWEALQLSFFQSHHYHTASSQRLREPVKKLNYKKLL